MAKLGCFESYSRGTARPGPSFTAVQCCSYNAAHLAIQGTLAALFERETSGEGQHVETSLVQGQAMMDSWIWFQEVVADLYPDAFVREDAWGSDGTPNSFSAFTLIIAMTADRRWLQFSQNAPHLFASLARALSIEDVLETPGWTGLPVFDDAADRRRLWDRMLNACRAMTYAEWESAFDRDHNVFGEVFRRGIDVLRHRQLIEGGWVQTNDDPIYGVVVQPNRVTHVDGDKSWTASPAPRLNEHDPTVLESRSAPPAPPDIPPPVGRLPLAGLTIVDLCAMFAAPYASAMLSDLGARVIHVERLAGDPIRSLGGFPEVGGMKVMQGKESVAVDLASEKGYEIVMRLVSRCDAVLQGFRAGGAAKMGLDGATLRARFPDLVYLDATGYGTSGPYSERPAYANSIAAAAGITMRNVGSSLGESDDLTLDALKEHAKVLGAFTASRAANADGHSAVTVASALMMALFAKRRGRGAHLETTMLSSTSNVAYDDVVSYEGKRSIEPDPQLLGFGALYRLYEATDGWIFLGCVTGGEWAALVKALRSYHDLDGDPRFATSQRREQHDAELAEVLAGIFAGRQAGDWEAELTRCDVACVISETEYPDRILMGEIGRASDYVTTVTHPVFGEHPRLAPLIRFSRSATTAGPGCVSGQHTDAILAELGYSPVEIAILRADQVVA
jgi:crotonobetainyl-CoA:carnitine CoA-transferase CaiB-like acyl-CoA transferase